MPCRLTVHATQGCADDATDRIDTHRFDEHLLKPVQRISLRSRIGRRRCAHDIVPNSRLGEFGTVRFVRHGVDGDWRRRPILRVPSASEHAQRTRALTGDPSVLQHTQKCLLVSIARPGPSICAHHSSAADPLVSEWQMTTALSFAAFSRPQVWYATVADDRTDPRSSGKDGKDFVSRPEAGASAEEHAVTRNVEVREVEAVATAAAGAESVAIMLGGDG
jgi:hypothetical protein